jgi:hypothetical protein
MPHRDVEHESNHPAVQAALRVVHEVPHLEADPAFLVGVPDLHPVKPYQEELAEVLVVGGHRLLERCARHGFI